MMKKNKFITSIIFILVVTLTACTKDKEKAKPMPPAATNIEIGYANNKQAIRGRDFHFNADVVAGERIATVTVRIIQKHKLQYADL